MRHSLFLFLIGSAWLVFAGCGGHGGGSLGGAATTFGLAPDALNQVPFVSGASTIKYYAIGSDPNLDVAGLDMFDAQDGNIYSTTLGPITCNPSGFCASTAGAFGQFNPVSKAFTEIGITNGAPQSVYMTPDGAVWGGVNSYLNGTVGSLVRFSPFSAAGETQISLPLETGASPEARDVTYNPADLNVYFTDKFGHRVGKLPAAGPYVTGS